MVTARREVQLLSPATIRELARRLGVRPSKRLGQNFVIEPGTVRKIAALAALHPADVVLEVGPGLGSLTLALLEAGASRVIAVEIDRALAGELPRTVAARAPRLADRVTVISADALSVSEPDPRGPALIGGRAEPGGPQPQGPQPGAAQPGAAQPGPAQAGAAQAGAAQAGAARPLPAAPTVLVANLPYNVAVPVVLHLLAALSALARGVVMVQAEVADRMCAKPGSRVYGAPSVKLAWYADARLAGLVPRTVFWPVPNVDSRLVAFTRHDPPATAASREEVFAVIDAAFRQRRKTLRAALAGWAGSAPEAERLLRAAGIEPGARGESLGVAEFARLAGARAAGTICSS
jgi:16S rRNA (adenine1518-N6/adenine1519-N6)-dimethyltransferase